MLSLFKTCSIKVRDNIISLDEEKLPEEYFARKVFSVAGTKENTTHVSKFGRIESAIAITDDLEEILNFLNLAYNSPELTCIYSGVQKTYKKVMCNPSTVMMRPTKEFFSILEATNIVAIDIDNWKVKEDIDVLDIDICGEYIYSLLNSAAPEIFPSNGGYVIKASSSAGIKSGLNYHMFFLNEENICIAQIKTIVKQVINMAIGAGFADPTVYSPARLWYAAKPLFKNPDLYPFKEKKYLSIKNGRKIRIPITTELDLPKNLLAVDISQIRKQFVNYHGIDPTKTELCEPISRILEKIHSGEISDLVWSKHALHIIFLAISYGYDLELFLEKVLRPALVEYAAKKHVSVDRYLEKVEYALKYATSTVTREISHEILSNRAKLSKEKLHFVKISNVPASEEGYLSIPAPFPQKGVLNFIKSSLGTGKTTTVKALIDDSKLSNVITITNRVSLVNSNARKLGLTSYKEMGTFEAALNADGLSVCLNSLSRKDIAENIFTNKYDTLFIDEADSVMYDLINASTITDPKREEILSCLQHLLNNCSYVILADGDMSCETIEAYSQLCIYPSQVFITSTETHSGVKVFEYLKEGDMHGALLSELESSYKFREKTLVVSDYGPAKIREMVFIVEAAMHDLGMPIRTLQIHDESKNDEDVRALLLNPSAPMDYDLVFTSPSVTSGIDFQGRFANVFCYTTHKVNTPNIRLQAICRERKPQHVYIHTGNMVESAWVDDKYYIGFNKRASGFIDKVRASYIQRDLLECEKYRFYMRYNMLLKGIESYEINSDMEELSEVWKKNRIKFKEAHLTLYINQILNSTPKQELKTMNKIGSTKQEVLAFAGIGEEELTYGIVESHLKDKPAIKAKNLYAIAKITPLWNELTMLKNNKVDLHKEKTLRDMFLRYLPEIKKSGAFVNLEFPVSTLRSMGFDVTLTPSKRLYSWDDTNAIANYYTLVELLELDTLDEVAAKEKLEIFDLEDLHDL